MGNEDIPVAEPWDVVRTMHELDNLDQHIREFMSHTIQTMSRPATDMWGNAVDGVEHPMGGFLSTIKACKDGCYRQYGESQFRDGHQMTLEFKEALGELDG